MESCCCSHAMFGQSQVVQFGASCQNKVVAEVCQSFRDASRPSCSAECLSLDPRVRHYHALVVVVLRRIAYLSHRLVAEIREQI